VAVSGDCARHGVTPETVRVYHVELRQFPHNVCHFNMTAAQLDATVVDAWARDQWIELGDRKWSPHQARLTVIESPYIPVEELSMGRGWRTAQREGQDVTERVLAAAREKIAHRAQASSLADSMSASAGRGHGDAAGTPLDRVADAEVPGADLLADSLGLELLGRLGAEAVPLDSAWALAGARHPEYTASECLALAERAVASLLRSGLAVLVGPGGEDGTQRRLDEAAARAALLAVESWTGDSSGGVLLRRA
jgi:hypothetical protein